MGMNALYKRWDITLMRMLSIRGLFMVKNILAKYKEGYQSLLGGAMPSCSELNLLNYFLW